MTSLGRGEVIGASLLGVPAGSALSPGCSSHTAVREAHTYWYVSARARENRPEQKPGGRV